ncbi:mucin-17-like isoform X2 [Scyliorhinus canicula]|uniref:mucin-17-like isoform X2 n=1 Tax=Scyliorhinus canicula TaxID=7830 RepID=UPI0018F79F14|nr:mucin-17-like isoform X2 [Scyliorhinus canicula]
MLVNSWMLSLSLTLSVLSSGFQQSAETDTASCWIEGQLDILLAIDGSGSVTPYEFSMARGLLEKLVGHLAVGPKRVRLGLLQVAGQPALELPLGSGTSQEGIIHALQDLHQLLGDTNSGQALAYAARRAWAPEAGGRSQATRLLLWVTDGYSSDQLEEASGLLRMAGVFTFVVTTGRRDEGLSLVASSPSQDFLFFTDVEELPGLSTRLCQAIKDLISPAELTVSEVMEESFRLSWGRMATAERESYVLEYRTKDRTREGQSRRVVLPWNSRAHSVRRLQPNTTYHVTLRVRGRESSKLQAQATTLSGVKVPIRMVLRAVSASVLSLDWFPSPDNVKQYWILYGPLTGGSVRALDVNGRESGVFLRGLSPNTTYLINISVLYTSGRRTSFSISGKTLPEFDVTTKWPLAPLTTLLGFSIRLEDSGMLPVTRSAPDTSLPAGYPTPANPDDNSPTVGLPRDTLWPSPTTISLTQSHGPAWGQGHSLMPSSCASEPPLRTSPTLSAVGSQGGELPLCTTLAAQQPTLPPLMASEGPALALATLASPNGHKTVASSRVTTSGGQQSMPTSILTSPDGQQPMLASIMTSPGGQQPMPTSILSSPDGQQPMPTSILASPDGQQSRPTSTLISLNGQSMPTSILTSSDGQQSMPTSISTSPDGQQSMPTSRLTSPDDQQSMQASILTSSNGQQSRPTSILTSLNGQSMPTSILTSPNGQQPTPTSILTPADGQSMPTSILTSTDSQSMPTSILTSTDGQQSMPTSISTSPDGQQSMPTSRLTSPDDQQSMQASILTSSNGQQSRPTSILTSLNGQSMPTSILTSPNGQQPTPTSILTPADGQSMPTSILTSTDSQSMPTSILTSTDGQQSMPTSISTSPDGQQSMPTSRLTSPDDQQSMQASILTSSNGQQSRPTSILTSLNGQSMPTSILTSPNGQQPTPTSILTPADGQSMPTSILTSSNGEQQMPTSILTSPGSQSMPTSILTSSKGEQQMPTSILTSFNGQSMPTSVLTSPDSPSMPTSILTSSNGEKPMPTSMLNSLNDQSMLISILTSADGQQTKPISILTSADDQSMPTTILISTGDQQTTPSSLTSLHAYPRTTGLTTPKAHQTPSAAPSTGPQAASLTERPGGLPAGEGLHSVGRPYTTEPTDTQRPPIRGPHPGEEAREIRVMKPMAGTLPRNSRTRGGPPVTHLPMRRPKAERPRRPGWGWTLPVTIQAQGSWQEEEKRTRGRPLPAPRGLMLTDATPTTLVASWRPSRGRVLGYLLRRTGVGGEGSEVRLPSHVHQVTYRHLKPGTQQRVCLRAIYLRGTSQALCARGNTAKDIVPGPILCPPPAWH